MSEDSVPDPTPHSGSGPSLGPTASSPAHMYVASGGWLWATHGPEVVGTSVPLCVHPSTYCVFAVGWLTNLIIKSSFPEMLLG